MFDCLNALNVEFLGYIINKLLGTTTVLIRPYVSAMFIAIFRRKSFGSFCVVFAKRNVCLEFFGSLYMWLGFLKINFTYFVGTVLEYSIRQFFRFDCWCGLCLGYFVSFYWA